MKVTVLESEKHRVKFSLPGNSHALANLITKALWKDSSVAVSGYTLDHPQMSDIVVLVETEKKDAKKVLLDTIKGLKKQTAQFDKAFSKAVKA